MANNSGSIHEIRKKVHATYELIATSYHEAGHAIYALLNCRKVDSVVVFENRKTKRIDGFTYYYSPDLDDASVKADLVLLNSIIEEECGIKYAGLAAEKFHYKQISGSDKFPMYWRDGSSDDTKEAAAIIKKYSSVSPGKKRYNYKKRIIKKTLASLEQYWDDVILVSYILIQKKRASFAELKEVLTKKSPNRIFWKEQFKDIVDIFGNLELLTTKEK